MSTHERQLWTTYVGFVVLVPVFPVALGALCAYWGVEWARRKLSRHGATAK